MELWIIYVLAGMLLSGVYVFVQKIFARKKFPVHEVVYYINLGQIFGGVIGWGVTGFSLVDWQAMLLVSTFTGIIYVFVDIFRIQALSYIDSAIFFPIYKAIGPALVTLAGVFVFMEKLSSFELMGIILGIIVPLMLLHRSEHALQKDLKQGLFFLTLSVVISSFGAVLMKYAADNAASPYLYVTHSSIVATIFMWLYQKIFRSHQKHMWVKKSAEKRALGFREGSLLLGVINAVAIFFLIKAAEVSLSVSYTINSFYILIPIILSIIFFREHMNLRKVLAIILSLFAILLFQL